MKLLPLLSPFLTRRIEATCHLFGEFCFPYLGKEVRRLQKCNSDGGCRSSGFRAAGFSC